MELPKIAPQSGIAIPVVGADHRIKSQHRGNWTGKIGCSRQDDPQTTIIEIARDGDRLLLWRKISPLSAVNSYRPALGVVFR